jgi:hypothetical protein
LLFLSLSLSHSRRGLQGCPTPDLQNSSVDQS